MEAFTKVNTRQTARGLFIYVVDKTEVVAKAT